jgi:hypothetical protein
MRQKLLLLLLLLTAWGARAQAPTWQSTLSSTAVDVRAVTMNANGDVFVTGSYTGSVTFGPNTLNSTGEADMFVAKWAAGASTWAWGASAGGGTAGSGGDANDFGNAIAVNGNRVYVTGQYKATTFTTGAGTLTNGGGWDMFLAKFTDNTTSVTASGLLGSASGSAQEYGYGVDVNPTTGNVYVTGYFGSNPLPTATISGTNLTSGGSADVYVAKYFDNGTTLSNGGAIRAGGASGEIATCLALNGNTIYVAGRFNSAGTAVFGSSTLTNGGANDLFVARFSDTTPSATGGLTVQNALRGGGDQADGAQGIVVSGASIYVTGNFNSASPSIAGSTLTNAGGSDLFLAKYTDTGSALANGYAIGLGGSDSDDSADGSMGADIDASGANVYITSEYNSSATIAGTALTSAGGSDVFVAKFIDNGAGFTNGGALSGGGAGNDRSYGIAVNSTQGVVGGLFAAPATFGSTTLSSGSAFAGRLNFATLPTVTTAAASSITATSALLGGNVTADGGAAVTDRGVLYSTTNQTPTIGGTGVTQDANVSGTGSFSETIASLAPGTTYYVRAYATNSVGTSYGAVVSFTTALNATVVSVTRLNPSPTATTTVSYRVVFSTAVTGLNPGNFSLTVAGVSGASISSLSGTGTTYTATVNTGTGNGTLRLNVANTTGVSPTITNLPYTAGESYTITKSFAANPQLTIQGTGGTNGPGGTVGDVTVFVDAVQVLQNGAPFANSLQNTSFETHDPLANGTFGYQPTGASWTFNPQAGIAESGSAFTPITPIPNGIAVAFVQSTASGNGQLQQNLAVPTGNYQVSFQAAQRVCCTNLDQALNVFLNGVFIGTIQPNSNAYTTFTSATFAVTALTATVSTTSASSTTTTPIPFAVNFSQSVGSTFTASDVTVTGGTLTSGSFSGSGSGPYTFTVTPSASGTVSVALAANIATDANNTGNMASNTVSVQYSQPATAAPVVLVPANGSIVATTPNYGGSAPVGSIVTVYVDGSALPNKTTANNAGNWAISQPTSLAQGAHTVYATAQTSGSTVSVNSATNTFTVDSVPPTVAINSTAGTSGSTTSTSPIPYTVTFSEAVTGFVAGDVTVSNGTLSVFTGSGTSYSFNVTPSANGTVTVSIPANVAQDQVDNGNTAAPQYSLIYSQAVTAAPSVTTPANGSVLATTTPAYSGSALAGSTVTVYVDGASIGTTTAVAGGTWAFTQPTALAQGSHTVYATAQLSGSAVSANSNTNSFTIDTVQPSVAIGSSAGASGSSTGTSPIPFTVTFSESVTGFTASSVTVTNGSVAAGSFTNSGLTYNFTVTPTTFGAVTVNVAANVAQDNAGNGNTAASQYSITYQPTFSFWTGSVSTDWYTAGNWSAGVPTTGVDATIPGSAPNMPTITSGSATARNLILNSGSALTQTGGTLTLAGNLTTNGTFTATGGTVSLGTTTQASLLGSLTTRFWNLTIGANGAQSRTPATTLVQRVMTLNGDFVTNGNPLTLESSASSTAMVVNNGTSTISGNVTVQRYIVPDLNPGLGYRHVSAPISSATVASLTTASFSPVVNPAYNTSATPTSERPFPTVYGYDQSRLATTANNLPAFDKGWFSPAALSDGLTVGQGYTVNISAGQTWNFVGAPNNGNVSQTLSRNTGATSDDSGLQLVGNPYPSPLDWSRVTSTDHPGVDDVIYVWASNTPGNPYAGNYAFFMNNFGNISPVLPLGQAFFVRVKAGQTSGTLNLKNSHRVTSYTNPTYHRTTAETRPAVQLTLKGGGSVVTDDAFVYFQDGATDGFDNGFDAEKLANPSGLNLSTSLSAKQRLSVDGRGLLGTAQQVVPLAVGVPAVGSYSLSAAQLLNLSATPVYLRDLQLGTVTDLRLTPSYQFTVTNASALITNRFELVFSPQKALATVPAALAQQVALYPNPAKKAAFVELPASLGRQAVTASLVDALGRQVRTVTLPAQGALAHQLDLSELATGVYALRLSTSAGVVVKKLVIE